MCTVHTLILCVFERLLAYLCELFLERFHFGFDLAEMARIEFVVLYDFISVFGEFTLHIRLFFIFTASLFKLKDFLFVS